jgi:hypothetical protein
MYTKDEARREIVAEWNSLPASARKTDHQAALFAMRIKDKYPFRSRADRYQVI